MQLRKTYIMRCSGTLVLPVSPASWYNIITVCLFNVFSQELILSKHYPLTLLLNQMISPCHSGIFFFKFFRHPLALNSHRSRFVLSLALERIYTQLRSWTLGSAFGALCLEQFRQSFITRHSFRLWYGKSSNSHAFSYIFRVVRTLLSLLCTSSGFICGLFSVFNSFCHFRAPQYEDLPGFSVCVYQFGIKGASSRRSLRSSV